MSDAIRRPGLALPLLVFLLGACSALLLLDGGSRAAAPPAQAAKPGRGHTLTRQQEADLRKFVYESGLGTYSDDRDGFPCRAVYVHKEIVAIHRANRAGTIRLLLTILEGARPKDARTAAGYAIALEEDAVAALICAYGKTDEFDAPGEGQRSKRVRLVARVRDLLAKAERATQAQGTGESKGR